MIGRCRRGPLKHEHHFEQHLPKPGEVRTRWVVALTALTMIVEVVAGIAFGSMALLADGLHMASHAAALGLSALAYAFARRHAHDRRFSFGTGKVNSLAGFASAIVLAIFAVMMALESVGRFLEPVPIAFDRAIAVAVLGLLVNGVSVFILRGRNHHHGDGAHHHDHDHTLRAAHLHVLADALTSLLAIVALLAAKYAGAVWMDPAMGIVGGALVARWSWGLMAQTSRVLLDRQAPEAILEHLRRAVESRGARIVDLHVWEIGPGYRAAVVSLESEQALSPAEVEAAIPAELGIAHLTVELRGPSGLNKAAS
ncbi:MAG TPA: CDF family Co(II)/Ni(II) efflux transporter DmeF [Chondromyces sp.]|nr:CDF family Co(II)/Ni(II) efflux transporter DmeF [Chondromyces sp.]